MTPISTRFKYFAAGLGLIAVAMVFSFVSYVIGAVRIALLEGRQVKINFNEYFRRPSIDELLTKYGYDNIDIEAWRADRVTI